MKKTKLIPGELYSDIQNANSKLATILRFMKTEGGIDSFQYVSGNASYFIENDGTIKFVSGCTFFPFTEK